MAGIVFIIDDVAGLVEVDMLDDSVVNEEEDMSLVAIDVELLDGEVSAVTMLIDGNGSMDIETPVGWIETLVGWIDILVRT